MKISQEIIVENNVQIINRFTTTNDIIEELTDGGKQNQSFYVCDLGVIIKRFELWKKSLSRIHPYYAVKCNNNKMILEILSRLGINFDCTSKNEINRVLDFDINTDRIVYTNPMKIASQMRFVEANGIEKLTFDSDEELYKIKDHHPKAKLLLRIRSTKRQASIDQSQPFIGCDPYTEAPRLLALAHSLNLDVIGLTLVQPTDWPSADRVDDISVARDLFDHAYRTLGYRFTMLDLGTFAWDDEFIRTAHLVNHALDAHFADESVEIVAETGRFLVSAAFRLACRVRVVRDVTHDGVMHRMLYVDDGVYGSFGGVLCGRTPKIPKVIGSGRGMCVCSVWGPTCDSLDKIMDGVILPEAGVGDWLVFEEMGDYTTGTELNGFPEPMIHYCIDEDVWSTVKHMSLFNDGLMKIINDVDEANLAIFDDFFQ